MRLGGPRNLYEVLGADPTSGPEAIRRAYVERIKEVHPDVHPGREDEAKDVNRAYEVLSNPLRRAEHDRALFGVPCPFCGRRLASDGEVAHVARHINEPKPRRARGKRRAIREPAAMLLVAVAALWMAGLDWTRGAEPRDTRVPPQRQTLPSASGWLPAPGLGSATLDDAGSTVGVMPSFATIAPPAACDPRELSRALNHGAEIDRAVVEALNKFARVGTVRRPGAPLARRIERAEQRLGAARARALLPTTFAIEAGRLMEQLLRHDAEAVAAAARGDITSYNDEIRDAYRSQVKYSTHIRGHGPGDLCA